MAESFERPDPDELLARLKVEEQLQVRGKLKIFLGYVAGVGKTYAMLDAAHQRMAEGITVIVGYIETHGRAETEAMLRGLEVLPRREITYRGITLSEMDLDTILTRRPIAGKRLLVLVDELAHTNAPGTRHPKRYQDIEEILSAGIDVYTTVNIQHLESLNDIVNQITGVKVQETVPDWIFDEADEIEVVDLPPDELLDRLRDGKVYIPTQVSRALNNFFRKGNLTALRELSLRRTAEQVDDQMMDYMHKKSIHGPWPASERIAVCINTQPLEERLVRAGRRLADDLSAEWYVVLVETTGYLHMPPQFRARIQRNLHLAEELGANVVTIPGESISDAVVEFAHENNITKIIVSKPSHPHWYEFLSVSIVDQIIRNSGQIDVYIVSEGGETPQRAVQRISPDKLTPHKPFIRYIGAISMVIVATLIGFPLSSYLVPANLFILYLISVVLTSLYLGKGPSILACVLSVLAFDFFFVNPHFSFSLGDMQYILTFVGLLIVGLIISNSTELIRKKMDILRRNERQSQALQSLGHDLAASNTLNQVLETTIRDVSDMFKCEAFILLPNNGHLAVAASTTGFVLTDRELSVADWAFRYRKEVGRGTTTLPGTDIRYFPLTSARGTFGVLGCKPHGSQDSQDFLRADQRVLMENVVNLVAIAIEWASIAEKAAQVDMLRTGDQAEHLGLDNADHDSSGEARSESKAKTVQSG